jgi:hypothetical protein
MDQGLEQRLAGRPCMAIHRNLLEIIIRPLSAGEYDPHEQLPC